jgi:hypothetical protein
MLNCFKLKKKLGQIPQLGARARSLVLISIKWQLP